MEPVNFQQFPQEFSEVTSRVRLCAEAKILFWVTVHVP